jgi:hypothetical protein
MYLTGMVLSRLEAHQGLHCEPPQRRARGVAIAIGILLSIVSTPIEEASIDAIQPKPYIRSILNHEQALCLIKLYGKESAFNRYAIGNRLGKKQAYGIPQLKNPVVAHVSSIEQVNMGIDYIEHRYQGDTCKAYAHYIRKGWH